MVRDASCDSGTDTFKLCLENVSGTYLADDSNVVSPAILCGIDYVPGTRNEKG